MTHRAGKPRLIFFVDFVYLLKAPDLSLFIYLTSGNRMKRRKPSDDPGAVDQNCIADMKVSDLDTLFKHHFEAQFEPLSESSLLPKTSAKDDEVEEGDSNALSSEWEGLSDQDSQVAVLVQHHTSLKGTVENTSHEYKTFMVCPTFLPLDLTILTRMFSHRSPHLLSKLLSQKGASRFKTTRMPRRMPLTSGRI